LNARGTARKVTADVVSVHADEMAKTTRDKHLRRVTDMKWLA
jgi:hypothetical protein